MSGAGADVQQPEHRKAKHKRSRYEVLLIVLAILCAAAYAVCLVLQYTQGWTANSPQRLGLNSITSGLSAVAFILIGLDNARRDRMYPAAIGFTIGGLWVIPTVVSLSALVTSR